MNKKRGECPVLVTRDSLLVTRVSPFAEATGDKSPFAKASGDKSPFAKASGDKPTPRRAGRDTPRPDSTHANYVCAGPGVGWWALARYSCVWAGQEVFDFWLCCVIIFRALDDYQCGV